MEQINHSALGGEPKLALAGFGIDMNSNEQIEVLHLEVTMGGHAAVLHPFVIYEEGRAYLFDTGIPGSYDKLNALLQPDYPVAGVILTHQDIDHVGTLPQWIAAGGGELNVYAHEGDRKVIDGTAPFLKATPERLNMMLSSLTPETAQQFRAVFSADTPPNVTDVLQDGDVLPLAGGLQVIYTPGHTPGHISLYHPGSKTLFAGDAMAVNDGQLDGPVPNFTPDYPLAVQSLQAFLELDIDKVVCYHGGAFHGDIHGRIRELVASS
ncbi:MBL fold metallo-hydrolase [Paenibacillus sp. WLX1005]|uniref:MBL fold metallo-hydrolase n=1 Tax=Paenibacillus sp. WLX1005 TaxID=3243766 RepID=UPI003984452B